MTLYHSTGIIAASGGAAAKPGMVLLKPTSIAHSGTSASIGANGQVTFTAVTSLSLNGVFSATYDNYILIVGCKGDAHNEMYFRLRSSGTDATGTNYFIQRYGVSNTTISNTRFSSLTLGLIGGYGAERSGNVLHIYGPNLAQPTATRNINVAAYNSAEIYQEGVSTHSLSTSYDGITLTPSGGNFTGTLTMYGVKS